MVLCGLLLLSSCVGFRGNRAPSSIEQARRWAAQREVRRYYNPRKRAKLFQYEKHRK